ncbi:MAG: hypothetical protein HQ504_03410 [Rhodospirillaceae bacterium]|nr:hypothetical protein [Rhodospirillaceae bacterium]
MKRKPRKVYYTDNEWELVETLASEHGYSARGEYVREITLKVTRSGPKGKELRGLIRTANALHGMALALSDHRTRVLAGDIRAVLGEVTAYLLENHHAHR